MSSSHVGQRINGAVLALLVAATAFGAIVAGVGALPASAAPTLSPTVSVSPASNLDPNGAFVVVSGSGYKPNVQLFVMQCRSTSAEDHTCNSVGLRKVTTNASGAFTANAMKVVANFGATNCLQVPCAIKTSAVADHATDRTEDRSATISFRAPAPPATTAPPVTAAPTIAVPQTTPPTTAPPAASTTTTKPGDDATTTTTKAKGDKTTTTTSAKGDETEVEGTGTDAGDARGEGDDESASGASTRQLSTDADDDGGSSPLVPILVVTVLAAAGVGGFFVIRSRRTA